MGVHHDTVCDAVSGAEDDVAGLAGDAGEGEQLRETEISAYTLKDTPIYTCIRMTPEAMLDRLG